MNKNHPRSLQTNSSKRKDHASTYILIQATPSLHMQQVDRRFSSIQLSSETPAANVFHVHLRIPGPFLHLAMGFLGLFRTGFEFVERKVSKRPRSVFRMEKNMLFPSESPHTLVSPESCEKKNDPTCWHSPGSACWWR